MQQKFLSGSKSYGGKKFRIFDEEVAKERSGSLQEEIWYGIFTNLEQWMQE